ncbi:MAG TPA: TonB-dependent receptor, partial [Candidatus Marinimicrobia bacterium]|nr:TonB-dependent receptor [Candidatus Neomarinimicrobiota bacterium]
MKKIKIILILLSIELLAPISLSGQRYSQNQMPSIGILIGSVVDSISKKPIAYASISLIRMKNDELVTGGVTDETGRFEIKEIPLGRYFVFVEFIGYKKTAISPVNLFPGKGGSIEQDLGKILLQLTTIQMEDVDIIGERPLFTHTIDKKIFNVEKNTLTTGGTALDALQQIPGVDVDMDGNISLRGNANVNVLIDGKPSSLTGSSRQALLENILADNISDIEVITNPSAKYDPDGMAGIINIVLKENRLAGLNGNISIGSDFIDKHNGSGQLNFRNEKVNIFANLGTRLNIRDQQGDNYQEMLINQISSILDQNTDGERGRNNVFIKSGIEYFLNRTNTFSLDATYTVGDRSRIRDIVSNQSLGALESEFLRTTDSGSDRKGKDLTLSYDRKFPDPKKKFSFMANHSVNDDKNDTDYGMELLSGSSEFVDLNSQNTDRNRTNNTTNIQADYVHPFGNGYKIETGYKGTLRSIDDNYWSQSINNLGEWSIDDSLNNYFIYHENIQAVYTQFSGQKGLLQYQLGSRIEHVSTISELKITNEKFENPYASVFPSGSISFGPPKSFQIQASYSRRINRPSFRRLNPFASYSDRLNIRKGNPFLKPEYIDVMELNISRFNRGKTITAGIFFRRTTDKIRHHTYVQDDGISVTTYENIDNTRTYGAELILSGV